jgi:hypothetical protein
VLWGNCDSFLLQLVDFDATQTSDFAVGTFRQTNTRDTYNEVTNVVSLCSRSPSSPDLSSVRSFRKADVSYLRLDQTFKRERNPTMYNAH